MDYAQILELAVKKQGMELSLNEIPFNVFLKNTDSILTICFLEYEDEDCMIVSETNGFGFEELRIIPKQNIEYISIFYDFSDMDKEEYDDKMII